jgi:hypothetical protein
VHVPRVTCSSTYTIGQPLLGAADMTSMLDSQWRWAAIDTAEHRRSCGEDERRRSNNRYAIARVGMLSGMRC